MNLITLLLVLIVLVIVIAIVWFFVSRYLIPLVNRLLPDPFNQIVAFLVVLILVVLLIYILLGLVGIGPGIGIKL